jgi:hypothetical protein
MKSKTRNTLGSRYRYKGGDLAIRTRNIETLTPCADINTASISVLLGLDIRMDIKFVR